MQDATHLVCPHCQAINRLPSARLAEQPKCGQCHQSLFSGQPIELTSESFVRWAKNSDLPLLVDFWAPWCGPCKMMAPSFVQAASLLEPEVQLGKVNTDIELALASQYGIRSIPTLILFHKGQEVARQAGAMRAPDIVRWAREYL
jgi:thioredoxin 2